MSPPNSVSKAPTGGTAMVAGRPAPEDSQMTLAAVTESAATSSTIRVVETEDQSNIECQKVLASRLRTMDTCGAIVVTTDPEGLSSMDSAGCGEEHGMLWSQE